MSSSDSIFDSKTYQNQRKLKCNIHNNQQIALALGLQVVFGKNMRVGLSRKSSKKTLSSERLTFPINPEYQKEKFTTNEKTTSTNSTINSMFEELERCGVVFNYIKKKKEATQTVAMKKFNSLNIFNSESWKLFAHDFIKFVKDSHEIFTFDSKYYLIKANDQNVLEIFNKYSNDCGRLLKDKFMESPDLFDSVNCYGNSGHDITSNTPTRFSMDIIFDDRYNTETSDSTYDQYYSDSVLNNYDGFFTCSDYPFS
ncbi:hypothetical protein QTN25_001061 [Entamoeba marina]